jgi:hypothetical protein
MKKKIFLIFSLIILCVPFTHAQDSSVVYDALLKLDVMDSLTTGLITKVTAVAASIAGICFVCSLAYNYFKSSFKSLFTQDTSEFPNYMEIGRGIVMIICIASYPAIAQIIATSVEFFNSKTTTSLAVEEQANNLKNAASKTMAFTWEDNQKMALQKTANGTAPSTKENQEYAQHATASPTSDAADKDVNSQGIKETLSNIGTMLDPSNLISLGLNAVAHMIVGIIHILIAGFAVIMFKILLIVGPLAFAFSILPCFEKQLSMWFGTVLNVGFVFTTLNIMEHIMCGVYTYIYKSSATFEPGSILVLDLVVIFSTCSCFWITSKFVGKGDGGRVLSKIISTAATAATMAVGAGAVGAAGGNLSSLTDVGSKLVNNSK